MASYQLSLEEITELQFGIVKKQEQISPIKAAKIIPTNKRTELSNLSWGLGPYIEHRLFNPDYPLLMETGLELAASYHLATGLKVKGALRKSVLTNLTENNRVESFSVLPHVHSDWPRYDIAGQSGHIDHLNVSFVKNLSPSVFGRMHAGLLEPMYAGFGAEILYKPEGFPFALGVDLHRVRQRQYDMLLSFRDYETTVGHFNFYYDAGGMFDAEINIGKYLAGDIGATTTISRKFGNGWEVGGYATLTDVPFEKFGEGSFDKAIFVSIPIDWITSTPSKAKRRLVLRPITRDGGAHLSSARNLYRTIEGTHNFRS